MDGEVRQAERLIPMGVDGFVTNVPERVYALDMVSKQDDSK